jgi:hypothetical protein
MVGTEVYILIDLHMDHVHRPCMLLFVHKIEYESKGE